MSVAITNSIGGKPIVAGTYTDTTSGFIITIIYRMNTTTTYTNSALAALGVPVVNHPKIVITAMDAATIKGTFSGDLYLNGDFTADKKR